jgi:hypothetical protein
MVMLVRRPPAQADVVVYDHESVASFAAKSERAVDWFAANFPENAPRIGRHWAVDQRYVHDVMRGLRDDGLAVVECVARAAG